MAIPAGKKPTRLAQKIIDILEPKLLKLFESASVEQVRYTGTIRADPNWGTHNCMSVLMFVCPLNEKENRWVDIHVGCMLAQSNFNGKIALSKGESGIDYYVERIETQKESSK